ncbi:phage antirepressor N-terminal domain-containing protein [Providencia rettgeri]|nr:phage antirepressor N-terminal domain-containing protein [Providencia rettgeri]MBG5894864.1 phage antirepressor N-terminal domain-containing protein [Providencia rettgeri]
MNTISTINVPFHGDNLYVVNYNGEPHVPMKPIVEGMGLDWKSQFSKIKSRFSKGMVEITIPTKGGEQSMICLALRKLAGWLHTISPNKVKPEIRDKVIQYQEECDDVLYEYWTTGEVKAKPRKQVKQIAGRITSEQQEAIKQLVLNRGKALPKDKQAKAMITMWSSLKSHFGCTYKEIDSDKFTEALSLAARVPLEGEYLPKQTERFVGCRVLHHYDDKGAIVKSEIAADDEQLTSPKVFADLAESRGYVMVKKDEIGNSAISKMNVNALHSHIIGIQQLYIDNIRPSLQALKSSLEVTMTERIITATGLVKSLQNDVNKAIAK